MAMNVQQIENLYSYLEIFFDEVDIVFEIDPQAGKIIIISNNQYDEPTKIALRDGVQKLLNKRPPGHEMTPLRLPIPIRGIKETLFILPMKMKGELVPKYFGVIVAGDENEKLEGFLLRNIRKKLESGGLQAVPGAGLFSKRLDEFKDYAKRLEALNAKRKKENEKLFGELKTIKMEKEFTEENYKKLLQIIEEMEAERDASQTMNEQILEENNKLITQLDEFKGVLSKVTEFENEREGYLRLVQEKDRFIQDGKREKGAKEQFLGKFKQLMLEINGEGQISYCNENVEKFYADVFGASGGVARNPYHKVLKSDDFPKMESSLNDAIKAGKEATLDIYLHKMDPKANRTEKVPFKLYVFPVKGGPEEEDSAGLLLWEV